MNLKSRKISKYFTALAIGTAALGYVTLRSIYNAPADDVTAHITDGSATASAPLLTNAEIPLAATREYLSMIYPVYDEMGCQDHVPRTSGSESPIFYRIAFEVSKDPYEQLCTWADYEPFKDKYSGELFFTNLESHFIVSDEEFAMLRHFQETFEMPETYISYISEKILAVSSKLAADEVFNTALLEWKPQDKYQNHRDALTQYNLKQTTLQHISDLVRNEFGLDPVPVHLYHFADSSLRGYYEPNTQAIALNYDRALKITDNLENAFHTILEETMHSIDHSHRKMFMDGEIRKDDVRALHIAATLLNKKMYITPGNLLLELQELSELLTLYHEVDPNSEESIRDFYRKIDALPRESLSLTAYKNQYLESTAKDFASQVSANTLTTLMIPKAFISTLKP